MGVFSGYGVGGGAYAGFYTVNVGTTQTALASTTPVYVCQGQISSDGAKDDAGVPTWTLDQIQMDSAFFTFVKTYAGTVTGQTAEDVQLEDGVQRTGAVSGATTLAMIAKGPKIVGGTDNDKIMSWAGLVAVAKSSGSVNFASGTYVKPNLVAVAQKIEKDLILPSSVMVNYQASTTGVAVTVTATADAYGVVTFN